MGNSWEEQKAVGNMAENIVEFLINSAPNWKCVKYGMENHIDQLKSLLKNNQRSMSKRIRSMPDFIAVNTETNEVLLIDVKYRSFIDRRENGTALYDLGYGQVKNYLEFWESTKLIVVYPNEPNFIVVDLKEVEWHRHFYGRKGEGKNMREQWNFIGIQKNIKEIFPELSDDIIEKAKGMILKKNGN